MEVWVSTILTTPWTCSTLVWRHSSKNLGRNRITSTENRAAIWQPCFHATGAPIRLPESHPGIRRPSYSAVTKALRLLELPLKEPPQHGCRLSAGNRGTGTEGPVSAAPNNAGVRHGGDLTFSPVVTCVREPSSTLGRDAHHPCHDGGELGTRYVLTSAEVAVGVPLHEAVLRHVLRVLLVPLAGRVGKHVLRAIHHPGAGLVDSRSAVSTHVLTVSTHLRTGRQGRPGNAEDQKQRNGRNPRQVLEFHGILLRIDRTFWNYY